MNNNLLRINLTEGKISTEEIPEKIIEQYIGGTGFISYYLYKELKEK